jgi:hypothetical protein
MYVKNINIDVHQKSTIGTKVDNLEKKFSKMKKYPILH